MMMRRLPRRGVVVMRSGCRQVPDHSGKPVFQGEREMSWQTISNVLGLTLIDEVFAAQLLKEPRAALLSYGIQLEPEELEALCQCQAQTLSELSEQLANRLYPGFLE
jgi:hypothetical protein